MKSINEYVREAYETAVAKGWHDQKRTPLEIHALIHSEISEATESVRNVGIEFWLEGKKPEGEAVELIDAVIRIFDYFGSREWDFEKILNAKMEYNKTRAYRHGGKNA